MRAEVVLRRVNLLTVRQSLRHGGTGLANASRADLDRLAIVGEEQVVGVDLDDAVGPHDLPIHTPGVIVPPRPSRPSNVPPSKTTRRSPRGNSPKPTRGWTATSISINRKSSMTGHPTELGRSPTAPREHGWADWVEAERQGLHARGLSGC